MAFRHYGSGWRDHVIVASLVILAADILVVVVVLGCASGRIGVNQLAGIRIRNVMASDDAWRVGHKAAIPATLIGSMVAAGLVVVSLFPFDRDTQGGLILAAAIFWMICLTVGAVFANRAAVELLADERTPDEVR